MSTFLFDPRFSKVVLYFVQLYQEYRLLETRQMQLEQRARGKGEPKDVLRAEQMSIASDMEALKVNAIINTAYFPLTMHWSLENSSFPELGVGVCGTIAAVAQIYSAWKNKGSSVDGGISDGSDDEFDWAEVPVPDGPRPPPLHDAPEPQHTTVEVSLAPEPSRKRARLAAGSNVRQMRARRALEHRVHLLLLMAAAAVRNAQCRNDALVAATAMSLASKDPAVPANNGASRVAAILFARVAAATADSHSPHQSSNDRAILLTALCRMSGLRARLIASLHPLPVSVARGALSPCYRTDHSSRHDEPCETDAIRLWTQIYDCAKDGSNTWINICPERGVVDSTAAFEPSAAAPNQQQLVYVLALGEDGGPSFVDITQAVSTRWASRIAKLRPNAEDEFEIAFQDWWSTVAWLHSEDSSSAFVKTAALESKKALEREQMPNRFDGFKDNSIYALERHLSQSEIIHPSGVQHSIGNFKGELVYPRSFVKRALSAANWRKFGRQVREGEVPVKQIKTRGSGSINKKREIEADRINNSGLSVNVSEMTDLFGEWQTIECIPEPLINGKIPRNKFGNFELMHENMMPQWGAHIRLPGAAAMARSLGFDFAPVMIGFEHHNGRATPVLDGVLVLKENKNVLEEAVRTSADLSRKKIDQKKSKKAIGNWRRLIEKAIVLQDLKEQYLE
ncbi:hypothetical protein HDU83_003581 [Entophlyctis luteolus]|nr:hypothetical protein HDU83_003581 [Entophlyctis luteolus]